MTAKIAGVRTTANRAEMLAAARELFTARGHTATTMKAVETYQPLVHQRGCAGDEGESWVTDALTLRLLPPASCPEDVVGTPGTKEAR
ncbi:hypothetical protein [Nocardia abscessus]|uniref:hypothetical protein n=1 Tax=Nocardia abscessus TaxID=120957 RepID=UPI001D1439D6|nr:hypothetical protein [Nocardia abscessus]MCC3331427.1 hypothetical protein [Nocardia abscessus]